MRTLIATIVSAASMTATSLAEGAEEDRCQDLVLSYVEAHSDWERRAASLLLGVGVAPKAVEEKVTDEWRRILEEYFFEPDECLPSVSFGTIPYHPFGKELVTSKTVRRTAAVVQTSAEIDSEVIEYFYLLRKRDGKWRIRDVLMISEDGVAASLVCARPGAWLEDGYFPYKELGVPQLGEK